MSLSRLVFTAWHLHGFGGGVDSVGFHGGVPVTGAAWEMTTAMQRRRRKPRQGLTAGLGLPACERRPPAAGDRCRNNNACMRIAEYKLAETAETYAMSRCPGTAGGAVHSFTREHQPVRNSTRAGPLRWSGRPGLWRPFAPVPLDSLLLARCYARRPKVYPGSVNPG